MKLQLRNTITFSALIFFVWLNSGLVMFNNCCETEVSSNSSCEKKCDALAIFNIDFSEIEEVIIINVTSNDYFKSLGNFLECFQKAEQKIQLEDTNQITSKKRENLQSENKLILHCALIFYG